MKWGRISSEFDGFGWKRLSSHEVDPSVSNGHEFQGVAALKSILGESRKNEIPAVYYLIEDDGEGRPTVSGVIQSTASWYDSREHDESRSAEWRLYYPADAGEIQVRCSPGDLMVVGLRHDGCLSVMLIKAGTSAETTISNLLMVGFRTESGRGGMAFVSAPDEDIGLSASEALQDLAISMRVPGLEGIPPPLPAPNPSLDGDDEVETIASAMVERWPAALGTCADVADLVVGTCKVPNADVIGNPDGALMRWLEAAEGSYQRWERIHLSSFLQPLRGDPETDDLELAEAVSKKWMSLRQGRVTRAGTMMELFLERIFLSCGLTFVRGCRIEGGKMPDFLFPGVDEYEDLQFPEAGLRILGSKTSFKDRWRQILSEGNRVRTKHGVTRDVSITPSIFQQMEEEQLVVVIPEPVRRKYTFQPPNLINLSQFVQEVRSAGT